MQELDYAPSYFLCWKCMTLTKTGGSLMKFRTKNERIFPIIFPWQHLNVQKLLGYFYFSKRYPGNYKEKAIFALFSQPARVVLWCAVFSGFNIRNRHSIFSCTEFGNQKPAVKSSNEKPPSMSFSEVRANILVVVSESRLWRIISVS